MSVSAIVPEKSRGNKKNVTKSRMRKKKNDTFLHCCKMAVTWLYATLDIYMFNLSRVAC